MKCSEVLRTLDEHRLELHKRFGIVTLALFGSTARDEATDESDVDLLVEFAHPVGLFHLARAQRFLREILGVHKVDLVPRDSVRPAIMERILREAIRA